ncbi:MAG: GGDEF domain-containing protein [Planctomycetaceae bacterium]|nr:GGDEF domain-containing protein [Planctomycetaceae bacterium]
MGTELVGFIVITFLIGALNLFVGYAVAVRLGYGPPTLMAPLYGPPSRGADAPPINDDDFEAMLSGMLETATDDMLDQDVEMELQPLEEPYDDEAIALLAADAPEIWDLNEKYVETSILRLNIAMMKSGARSTEIDTELRAARGHLDEQTIMRCWQKLKEDCESYLAEQSEASERFSSRIGELGELGDLAEQIELANMNQASQIETTISNLNHMDFKTDLEAANVRLIEEIANLRNARHQLRDNQEMAFLTIARYENRIDKIEEKLFHDSLTGVRNRIGLEAALHDWWQQHRHTSRSISAVLFDLDHFERCNEEQGSLIGDRVLCHIGQMILSQAGRSDLVGRFAGQRFLLLAVDSGPRAAIKAAETLRQTIEKIVFVSGDVRFGITASGGVTEVSPEDGSYLDVFQRLEACVKAAKKQGRNRLFECKRTELDAVPEQIEAPSFGIEEREIRL